MCAGGVLFCRGRSCRIRVGEETLTVPRYGGALVGPRLLRQLFNDTEFGSSLADRGWPEAELDPTTLEHEPVYPVDPSQLPSELKGVEMAAKA